MGDYKLQGNKAIVTGASRGMGLAIAESLASEGVKVFMTARDEVALNRIKSDFLKKGFDVDYAPADLADSVQVEKMFALSLDFLGGLDILINNAGIGLHRPVKDMAVAELDEMLAVNLRAPFILSKLAAPIMISQGSGFIINIGSGASHTPIANLAGYCASKHGLLGFSESLALELRDHGIKVSIVMPGSTATYFGESDPQNKLQSKPGMLRPQDIADSILYLLRQSPNAWTSIMNLRPLNLNKGR